MARIKRLERIVALTKELTDHPFQLYPFSYFCEKFTVAKSTLSEDVQTVRNGLSAYDLGIIETVAGPAAECALSRTTPLIPTTNFWPTWRKSSTIPAGYCPAA